MDEQIDHIYQPQISELKFTQSCFYSHICKSHGNISNCHQLQGDEKKNLNFWNLNCIFYKDGVQSHFGQGLKLQNLS